MLVSARAKGNRPLFNFRGARRAWWSLPWPLKIMNIICRERCAR